jgi:hypothetical protein
MQSKKERNLKKLQKKKLKIIIGIFYEALNKN